MIEQVHKQIVSELRQNTKTDIIFILSSIVLNLLILAVNVSAAIDMEDKEAALVIMFLFVALIVLLNIVVVLGLLKGKQTRTKLLNGLIKMYRDEKVEKYYDTSLPENYNTRYNLFTMVVVLTGLIAIVVPFLMR